MHTLLDVVRQHPLLATWLGVISVLVLLLGVLHICRIFAACLLVLIREVKHELSIGLTVLRELKKELTRWTNDP